MSRLTTEQLEEIQKGKPVDFGQLTLGDLCRELLQLRQVVEVQWEALEQAKCAIKYLHQHGDQTSYVGQQCEDIDEVLAHTKKMLKEGL